MNPSDGMLDYQLDRVANLGKGAFSEVICYRCLTKRQEWRYDYYVAIKSFSVSTNNELVGKGGYGKEGEHHHINEVSVLTHLFPELYQSSSIGSTSSTTASSGSCPFIVKVYQCVHNPLSAVEGHTHLIQEAVLGGPLHKHINVSLSHNNSNKTWPCFDSYKTRKYTYQLICALQHLHSKQIVHR